MQISFIHGGETHSKAVKGNPDLVCLPRGGFLKIISVGIRRENRFLGLKSA